MNKNWPFGFFVYRNLDDKYDTPPAEPDIIAEEDGAAITEAFDELTEELEEIVEEVEDVTSEPLPQNEEPFDEDDEDKSYLSLEEELEIALEKAYQREEKKHRLIKGITTGVVILGAIGFATGFGIRAFLRKK